MQVTLKKIISVNRFSIQGVIKYIFKISKFQIQKSIFKVINFTQINILQE